MQIGEDWGEGLVWGMIILSATLTLLFLLAAGLANWTGASDLANLSGAGALASAVMIPLIAALIYIVRLEYEYRERGMREKVGRGIDAEKMTLPLIIAAFPGTIALYAALRMLGISVEPELVAIALVGLTAVGVLWIIMRPPKDMGDLKETLHELSERADRLRRLLEE